LRYFVTGCAGFIGSTLTDRLLSLGHEVVGYDNFSTGRARFLERALAHARFRLIRGELSEAGELAAAMRGCELVFHLAANADVRHGLEHPRRDLEQNTLATLQVLEAMRAAGLKHIAFTSSGAVYGDAVQVPTPEEAGFPIQTSLYGASKAAAEGLIGAYCAGLDFRAHIFRCVSVLGERYAHGHVLDFQRQLAADPLHIRVLGDGRQRKSYIYVHDCIDAMLLALERATARINILNVGTEHSCSVDESLGWICAALGVQPQVTYGGGERGWAGDSPLILLDVGRLRALGWQPRLTIREAVQATVEYLRANPWVLESCA